MVLENNANIKNEWTKPTVNEVFQLMVEAAERYKVEDWREVCHIIGVSDRTFRRWKNKVETEPQAESMIPFWGYALLHSAAKGVSYLTPIEGVKWQSIPKEYFYKPNQYQCPSKSVLTQLVGKQSITGLTREEIGQAIGISPKKLAEQINLATVSFSTWTLLLLFIGVPVDKLLKK